MTDRASAPGRASGAPQEITDEETHVMESGATRGVDDDGLDRSASDVAGVQAATDASPHEGPRGTYNCPVCGWNVPHREHAGEVIEQLSFELNAWKAWWQHVVLMLRSGIRPGCSLSVAKLACDELIAGRGARSPAPFIAPMFDKRPLVPALSSPSVADSPTELAEADARILHLEAAIQGVLDAYGDAGWARSEMCRRLRHALESSAPSPSASAPSTTASATTPDGVTNRVVPSGEDSGRVSSVAESPTPKERHLMDVYDSLGIKWGDDPFSAIDRLKVADSPTLETHHEALRLIEKLVERDCMNWQMCGHQTCQEVRRLLLPSAPSPSAAAHPKETHDD